MRVLLLSSRFPPQRCGIGDYTCFLGGALSDLGHSVDILTGVGPIDNSLYPLSETVRVHRLIENWAAGGLRELIQHVRKLDPEVVLLQYSPSAFDTRGVTFAVNLFPALLRLGGGSRLVTNFHELFVSFDGSMRRRFGGIWQRAAAFFLATASHGLSVTTASWARALRAIGIRRPVQVIPVGSNIPVAPSTYEERSALRRKILGPNDGVLMAGFGARHDRDLSAVLAALGDLKKKMVAKLVWIGGGEPDAQYQGRLAEWMRGNGLTDDDVRWTGTLPHPQVSRLLSAADCMILPFIDGVSARRTSAVSALQHGLPLLTTGGDGEPWFIHGKNVYLTPVGDSAALREGLRDLVSSPELRATIAHGARKLYDERFAWEVIARGVATLAGQN